MPRKKQLLPNPNAIDPNANMPADRMQYHRNKNVQLAPNTAVNRSFGNAGRVIDPSGGRPLEGMSGQVMRKGNPSDAPYSGDLRSKIGLGMVRLADTAQGMFGKSAPAPAPRATPAPKPRPAPRAATNSPGGMPQRRPPPAGATMADTMAGMAHTPGYEPFPGKKKRR